MECSNNELYNLTNEFINLELQKYTLNPFKYFLIRLKQRRINYKINKLIIETICKEKFGITKFNKNLIWRV